MRSGLLLKEAQLPKSGAGSGGGATSEGGVTGKLKGSAVDIVRKIGAAGICEHISVAFRRTKSSYSVSRVVLIDNFLSGKKKLLIANAVDSGFAQHLFH